MQASDSWVIILLLLGAAGWLYFRLKRQQGDLTVYSSVPMHDEIIVSSEEALELIQGAGYEWLAGKVKIPITITVDDNQLESRLFADGFVEKDRQWFVVKFAKERKPIEMTGSGIREHLLVYSLLYPQAAGVLYVDVPNRSIRRIQFEIEG
ncbi:MAG: hypothetical protein K0R67_1953 [Paenibacillus sp.]|nr:hypothetical protein [Paenibacillus sp.]